MTEQSSFVNSEQSVRHETIFDQVHEIFDFFKEDLEHNRKKLRFTKPKDLLDAELGLFMKWRQELHLEFDKIVPEEKRAQFGITQEKMAAQTKAVNESIVDIELLKDQLKDLVATAVQSKIGKPVSAPESQNVNNDQLRKIQDQQNMLAETMKQMHESMEKNNQKMVFPTTPKKEQKVFPIERAESTLSTPQFSARGARVAKRDDIIQRDTNSSLYGAPHQIENPPSQMLQISMTNKPQYNKERKNNQTVQPSINPSASAMIQQPRQDSPSTAPVVKAQSIQNDPEESFINTAPPEQTNSSKIIEKKATYKLKFTIYDQIKDEAIKNRMGELGPFEWEPKPEGFKEAGLEWSVLGRDPEGGLYEGQRLNGQKHGRGVYMHDDYLFEGYFANDVLEGRARKIYDDGDVFDAFWKAGSRFGYSNDYYQSGAKFKGYYEDDYRKGLGCYQWPNGSKWEGEFFGGYMNDTGKWTYKNGVQRELKVEYEIPEEFDADTI